MQRVIIQISFNTPLPGIAAFGEIENRARFRSKQEVVFDYGALFNITDAKYDLFSETWNIEMVAVSRNSIKEHPYLASIRETFIQNHSAIVAFGIIMGHGFGRHGEAIQCFNEKATLESTLFC
jgi:hypothetical protein